MNDDSVCINESNINLNSFLSKLPKLDFHAHLNGVLNLDIVRSDLSQESINIIEECKKTFSHDGFFQSCRCLNPFLNPWNERFKDYLKKLVEQYIAENCIYLELRDFPRCKIDQIEDYFMKYYEIVKEINEEYKGKIFIRLVIGMNKHTRFQDTNVAIVDYFKNKCHNEIKKYVLGVDLCGEHSTSFNDFTNYKYLLSECRSIGLKQTVHFYETEKDNFFKDIVIDFKPNRVSQGIFLENKEELDLLIESKIPLEICPSTACNFTGKRDLSQFNNFKYLKSQNTQLVVGVDNMLVFDTNLTKEYTKVYECLDFESLSQFTSYVKKSIDCIFDEEDVKREVVKLWESKVEEAVKFSS